GPEGPPATGGPGASPFVFDVQFGRARPLYALSQAPGPAPPRGRPRSPAPASWSRPPGTAPSPPSPIISTGRPRSSSSAPPPTFSPSAERSGRSTASPPPYGAAR